MSARVLKQVTEKTQRLETRISPEIKSLCQRAASIQGRSLTDFVVQSALEAATRTIRENEFIELSRGDRLAFIKALLDPPTPNARLKQANQRHNQLVQPE